MATKPQAIQSEVAHFTNFSKYLPHDNKVCKKTVMSYLYAGLIQVSTALEHAISYVAGNTVVNEDTHDISDGSEVKLCTSRYHPELTANVSNMSGKKGKLRVHVYEQYTGKFYYFVIPPRAHKKVKHLEIPFNLDGTPKRTNHWWAYEVETFVELATK